MNTPDSQQLVGRFFDALSRLISEKRIRGKKTFTDRYGINRRNMFLLERDHSRDIFQPAWLSYLARDYGISPSWLLLGEGDFYPSESPKQATDKQSEITINITN